jgi:adenosylcobalamin-dependent ribonucleoside-triphosphate reductase
MPDAQLSLFPSTNIPGASFGEDPIEARKPDEGMGMAVARRTVFRKSDQEDWGKVADRVAYGNMSLAYAAGYGDKIEEQRLRNAIASGALLTSGRHLQHGDENQVFRPAEVFTNCSSSITCYAKFLLLLCGSGVGRSYDDELMVVDWAQAPDVLLYLSSEHIDHWVQAPERFAAEFNLSVEHIPSFVAREFITNLPDMPAGSILYRVQDSREGWAKAVEIWESLAYAKDNKYPLVLDFSDVRPCGAPIHGMQERPASGPLSIMRAFMNVRKDVIAAAKINPMPLWEQNLRFDHFFSVEVQVGGARRAARMATKSWKDPGILKFIRIKEEGGLWTANHSIMVDQEFWMAVRDNDAVATKIFDESTRCAYETGEPGFINADKLEDHRTGFARKRAVDYDGSTFKSKMYKTDAAVSLVSKLSQLAVAAKYPVTTNPCGEQPLHILGGYCTLADSAPLLACPLPIDEIRDPFSSKHYYNEFSDWDKRVEDALRLAVRFLIRVNQMDCFYSYETKRTNRIGVALTGIHEWAWLRFGIGFIDMLDEGGKAATFWRFVQYLSDVIKEEANTYSDELGLQHPVTVPTIKPSGTTAKVFGITEGAHLPAKRYYLRWVQFRGAKDKGKGEWIRGSDTLLAEYEERGYLLRELITFPGMTIVGFPTAPIIMNLGMGDKIVTAPEATPEQQYEYLRLLEKYWLGEERGSQVSYSLKLYKDQHSLEDFRRIVLDNQPTIRCCAIMPVLPESEMSYEYLPEESVSQEEFDRIVANIKTHESGEHIDMETLRCASGVCPI